MSKILFCVVLLGALNLVNGRSDTVEYFSKKVKIGQCRAACLYQFPSKSTKSNNQRANNSGCATKSNWKCNMCWDYCEMLNLDKGTDDRMCTDEICFDGCKYACKFYKEKNNMDAVGEEKVTILNPTITTRKISWTSRQTCSFKIVPVFIVFGLKSNNKWQLLDQTTETRINLDIEAFKLKKITIIAVSKNAILGLCSKKLIHRLRYRRQVVLNFPDRRSLPDKNVVITDFNYVRSAYVYKTWVLYFIVGSILLLVVIMVFKSKNEQSKEINFEIVTL